MTVARHSGAEHLSRVHDRRVVVAKHQSRRTFVTDGARRFFLLRQRATSFETHAPYNSRGMSKKSVQHFYSWSNGEANNESVRYKSYVIVQAHVSHDREPSNRLVSFFFLSHPRQAYSYSFIAIALVIRVSEFQRMFVSLCVKKHFVIEENVNSVKMRAIRRIN